MPTLFEQLGGIERLRAILQDFYDRVFADSMIGFFFRKADKQRLIDKEVELVAALLGAPGATYTGRPLREAHAPHRIMGGQFARRLQILKETLDEHGVPAPVREAWLEHTERLRPLITPDSGDECKGS